MIDSALIEQLHGIGLVPAVLQQANALAQFINESTLMRVIEVQRENLTLHDGNSEQPARLLPALRWDLASRADALAVGDWIYASRNGFDEWWVHTRLPPINQLARRLHDGRDKVTRVVIVSNVDTALLVMGLDHDFNLRRLERYVALVRMAGVEMVVVLTKKDLCADPGERLLQVLSQLPPDTPVVAINALGDEPAQALAPWMKPGRTLVLMGSSGAGKSTLTNALAVAAVQSTGMNRAGDSRGRHTTTSRSLHLAVGGACIIDTPGLRTLRLDGDASQLDAAFEDISHLALQCRFRDCQHEAEPGCAVREGVSTERLRNYGKLLREAQRDTQTVLERKTELQQWKAKSRNRHARLRADGKPR